MGGLDLAPYCTESSLCGENADASKTTYDLVGLCKHIGSLGGGLCRLLPLLRGWRVVQLRRRLRSARAPAGGAGRQGGSLCLVLHAPGPPAAKIPGGAA